MQKTDDDNLTRKKLFNNKWKFASRLTESIPQAEEITLDNNGTLYVLSEPNLFYTFHFNG
ncbi:MAG: SdiA-regulated domain-containing protein [Porticoccus sp.]